MTPEQLIDELADLLAPRLAERGFVQHAPGPGPTTTEDSVLYDAAMCARFLDPAHIGDGVLERAKVFFDELDRNGEIMSLDLVAALGVKGPRSIPANLTIPLKKSARRIGLPQPWRGAETSDGQRTIWQDYDGIAGRMRKAIEEERESRGLA